MCFNRTGIWGGETIYNKNFFSTSMPWLNFLPTPVAVRAPARESARYNL